MYLYSLITTRFCNCHSFTCGTHPSVFQAMFYVYKSILQGRVVCFTFGLIAQWTFQGFLIFLSKVTILALT